MKYTHKQLKDIISLSKEGCSKRVCREGSQDQECMWYTPSTNECLMYSFGRPPYTGKRMSEDIQKIAKDIIRGLI